jgi:hypothetical protein
VRLEGDDDALNYEWKNTSNTVYTRIVPILTLCEVHLHDQTIWSHASSLLPSSSYVRCRLHQGHRSTRVGVGVDYPASRSMYWVPREIFDHSERSDMLYVML